MKTTDWKFNFASLPRWDNRKSLPGVYDSFYESDDGSYLCCIYSLFEVRMCSYQGFLAILKNKNDPALFLNVADGMSFNDVALFSRDNTKLFLSAHIYDKATNTGKAPIIVIDLKNNTFSYFCPETPINLKFTEEKEGVLRVEYSKFPIHKNGEYVDCQTEVMINELRKYDLKEINSLPETIFNKKSIFSFFKK